MTIWEIIKRVIVVVAMLVIGGATFLMGFYGKNIPNRVMALSLLGTALGGAAIGLLLGGPIVAALAGFLLPFLTFFGTLPRRFQ